jgi:hypothetical protein
VRIYYRTGRRSGFSFGLFGTLLVGFGYLLFWILAAAAIVVAVAVAIVAVPVLLLVEKLQRKPARIPYVERIGRKRTITNSNRSSTAPGPNAVTPWSLSARTSPAMPPGMFERAEAEGIAAARRTSPGDPLSWERRPETPFPAGKRYLSDREEALLLAAEHKCQQLEQAGDYEGARRHAQLILDRVKRSHPTGIGSEPINLDTPVPRVPRVHGKVLGRPSPRQDPQAKWSDRR